MITPALVFRFIKHRPVLVVSGVIVCAALLAALLVPYAGFVDPEAMDAIPSQPPNAENWFGTDNFGRDIFTRILWGTRVALVVAVGSSALSTVFGASIGSVSGFYGGTLDALLSRTFDVFLLIPTFFLVLLIVNLFGSSLGLTMLALAVTTWPRSARIMRSQVLTLRSRTYVHAALSAGATRAQALVDHVIPNGLGPVVTDGAILMGAAILTEAGLSFLGLGDQNTVSWGRMIYEGQSYLRLAPWMSIFPGLAMLVLVAALNFLADGLNQLLSPQRNRFATVARPRGVSSSSTELRSDALLSVRDLQLAYRLGQTSIHALDGVSFDLDRGGSLGIVGESGCGKSSLGSALLQLLPANATMPRGTIAFDGKTIVENGQPVFEGGRSRFDALRWTRVAVVFQGAMTALNPVLSVRRQMIDAYRLHRPQASRREAEARAETLFDAMEIPRARLRAYPHELSGGMRQRVMIALSLVCEPDLLVADEPTTALDVLVQDQILGEIDGLRKRLGLALILISHDIGAVAETCDRVAVMYAGQIVESAAAADVFERPSHPYTRALLDAALDLTGPRQPLVGLPGEPFVATDQDVACRFAPRCQHATDLCRKVVPPEVIVQTRHSALCHYAARFFAAPKTVSQEVAP